MSPRKNNFFSRINPLQAGIIAIISIFIILIIVVIISLNSQPSLNSLVTNLSDYKDKIPSNIQQEIADSIIDTVSHNNPSTKSSNYRFVIRNDTFDKQYDSSSGVYTVAFIIDSESLQQSYQVDANWSNSPDYNFAGDDITTTCLAEDLLIYPPFNCNDSNVNIDGRDGGETSTNNGVVSWPNYYQLMYTFGDTGASYIYLAFNRYLKEKYVIPNDNADLSATINANSFHALDGELGIYTFDLNLSNGQTYNTIVYVIYTRDTTDVALYAKNITSDDYYATIVTDNPENNASLADWLRSYLNLPDLQIIMQTPKEIEAYAN